MFCVRVSYVYWTRRELAEEQIHLNGLCDFWRGKDLTSALLKFNWAIHLYKWILLLYFVVDFFLNVNLNPWYKGRLFNSFEKPGEKHVHKIRNWYENKITNL